MATFQPLGKIELIRNVDIDISYTHQYYFRNSDQQETFFSGKVFLTLENGTYQRKNINTIQVPYQADEIADCKYLRWQNRNYSTKWYYAFVTSIDYINPGVSQINYVLDVYQTYLFEMQWKQSFVEREHTQRWTTDSQNNQIPVVNTEPEGMEYGSEYLVLEEKEFEQIPDVGWIVFGSTKIGSSGVRNIGNIPTGIIYTFVPISTNQKRIITFTSGGRTILDAGEALRLFATDTTLVNSLCSVVFYPFLPIRGITYTESGDTIDLSFDAPITTVTLTGGLTTGNYVFRFTSLVSSVNDFIVPVDLRDDQPIYGGFPSYTESKLLMFPYSFMELTTKRGDSMVVKMEYLVDRTTGNPVRIGAFGTISSVNKMVYALRNYMSDINGYNMMNGLADSSNSNLPITDDYTASYMQANSNSLRVAESNARYSELTNLDNAYRSYETAMSKRSAEGVKDIASVADNTITGGLMSVIGSLVGSAGMMVGGAGSIGSGIAGAVGGIADYIQSGKEATSEYWNRYYSATTDYGNAVASVMAKKNDAKQIPPTSKSLGGDYLFNMANNCDKLYLIRKTIYPEYANKLSDYFKQYGYKVNRLEVPSFRTRQSWNYIKMTEPNVYGNIPMDDLMQIRDIFIKGITLWHGDYIGDYSRSNNEI